MTRRSERSDEPLLNLYSDRSFLPPRTNHVPMLYPFWGRKPGSSTTGIPDPFDRYVESANEFFRMSELDEADVAVLPASWVHVMDRPDARALAVRFAAAARAAGKRIVVFFNSDSSEEVPLENSLVFRTSLFRSRKKATEFSVPAWSEDFVVNYLEGRVPLRKKTPVPVVGFCGFAATPLRSRVRHLARWGASILGLRKGSTTPFEQAGHGLRLVALRALARAPGVETNFLLRDAFVGPVGSAGTSAGSLMTLRREYVANIVNSDYTLCVRGVGNFSYRLYETLSCGRIPVFVDTDCVLPYESHIDWRRYCVWVNDSDVKEIGAKVADFHARLTPERFVELQRDCRKLWEDYLSPEGFFRNFHRHLT